MAKLKVILRTLSLALFIAPPAYFVYSYSGNASVFARINISGCLVLIIGILLANRFVLSGLTEKWRAMITQWRADFKVEPDPAKKQSLRHFIGKYENILLAFKIPLPAVIIVGLLAFLSAIERAAASLAATLGVCSLFWAGGVVLLFIANGLGARKPKP